MAIRTDLSHSTNAISPSIVGRAHEREALRRYLDAACAGQGNVVLVAGESGIGKTTLVRTLGREAEARGAIVLTGSCYDLSATSPYGLWLDLLAAYEPSGDLPSPPAILKQGGGLDEVASQESFFADIHRFLVGVALEQPLVLILEDLHWADPASLDLLRYLGRRLNDLPLLAVGTYRPHDLTRHHPLYQLLPSLVREAEAERLNLRRLGDDEIRALVAGRYVLSDADELRLVTHLRDLAEGNPFFTEEILRTLEEGGILRETDAGWLLGEFNRLPVPPLLKQVIDGRLVRLGEETRDLLAVAAVIGQEVPYDLWRTVSGASDDALSTVVARALEAHLLEELASGEGFLFTHALVREALYEGVPLPHRRSLHGGTGEALAMQSSASIDLVAYHFREARHQQAADWLMRAGERAERLYAWRTAAERFESVLPLLDIMYARERGWLLYRIGLLLRYADPARGIGHLEEAERLAHDAGDAYLAAYAVVDRGLLRCLTGDARRGLDDTEQGVAALDTLLAQAAPLGWHDDQDTLIPLAIQRIRHGVVDDSIPHMDVNTRRGALALWLSWVGRYTEAVAIGERHLGEVRAEPRASRQLADSYGDALAALGHAYAALGRPDDALRYFARARDTYGSIDHHFKEGNTAIYELFEVVLPYRTDQVEQREWIAMTAEDG